MINLVPIWIQETQPNMLLLASPINFQRICCQQICKLPSISYKSKPWLNDSNKEKYKIVADAVIYLWNKASVPIIQVRSVVKR